MSMKRMGLVAFLCAVSIQPSFAQEAKTSPIPTLTVHPIRSGAFWVEGGASNTGFIVGDKGVVVIDAQMTADAARRVLADIAKITAKPVDTIILTHADPDHVGGLTGYPPGVAVIAQENARSTMEVAGVTGARWGVRLLPMYRSLAPYLPTRTIGGAETINLDGVRAKLIHVAPAHTSGDMLIYLPAAKIVYAGDIVLTNKAVIGRFPIIHPGGSSLGWIATMKALLALDADTYVPGHGLIEPRDKLEAWLQEAEKRRDDVKAMVEQGKSLAEVEKALPDNVPISGFDTYTRVVYQELTKGYPPA